MTIAFDNYLKQLNGQWQWQLPDTFNIAKACVTDNVARGKQDDYALIVEDHEQGTRHLTYGELEAASARFANMLDSLGVQAGERVLIRLPNSVDYPIAFFGCIRHGAIAVPTSTLLAAPEVAYLAQDSGARLLVTAKSMWDELKSIGDENSNLETILLAGDGELPRTNEFNLLDLSQSLAAQPENHTPLACSPHDPAYLVYTSGTTGYPKGVLHAHRSMIGRIPASRYWFDFKEGDRIMHSGKFNWTYVLGSALMDPLFHGHTVIVHEGPNDASTWPKLIAKHQCTIFIGVPTIYRQIIQKTEFSADDVPSLRHCMSAGEHLSDEMLAAWRQRFGMDVYEAIGMSEFSYYISQRRDRPIRPGAAGFIQPGHQVELLDANLKPVADEEEGMICIPDNDPGLFIEYWRRPEETAEARHSGYFFTGDYARRDKDGYIWFLGRKDDIINTFGYRVSPHEIERVMKAHPQVADCVALGEEIAPEKVLVSICVIPVAGSNLSEQDLLDYGNANLAKYKAPKIVHFYQDFPRTKNGKVLRKQLLHELAQKRSGEKA